ncbi:MAG: flagellar hook-basal body complex protein FliE [Zetaproteobacteria bacterium]|nr:MAG: flagellar hook-basal body complex protein FliE [Zetaproteobacteria bacterium]
MRAEDLMPKRVYARMAQMQEPRASSTSEGFAQALAKAVDAVNAEHRQAEAMGVQLAEGKVEDVSAAVLQIRKAEVSFALMLAVRNKLLEAYREVMRMQI